MNSGEEVREVADPRWQMHRTIRGVTQQPVRDALDLAGFRCFAVQQFRNAMPQRPPRLRPAFQPRIERTPARRLSRVQGYAGEQSGFQRRADVKNLISDRDTAAWSAAAWAEHAIRQILNPECPMSVGGLYPAGESGVVRLVNHWRAPVKTSSRPLHTP